MVKAKLAACVNIIHGITSIFTWENEVEEDSELLLMIKLSENNLSKLTEMIKEIHPYDVCEVISTPITGGNVEYINWIKETSN